jgi:hypothetical protein
MVVVIGLALCMTLFAASLMGQPAAVVARSRRKKQ